MTKFIELSNIGKKFNTIDGEIEAIKNISFDVLEGDFVAIVGSSGCGKSTLLSIIAGLNKQSVGDFSFRQESPRIGYMLQEDALFEHLTIMDNILLGLKILKQDTEENKEYALNLLKKYNLESFKDKYPRELSGGMKQRVALIRTLAIKPDLLLLDEPFSALDYSTRLNLSNDVYDIIKSYGKTTIMITHDIGEAVSMASKVIVLSKSPAVVKSIYKIELENKTNPMDNRKDEKFNYYFDLIWNDLDEII